jgi:hypothetical protein
MAERRFSITASRVIALDAFFARHITVDNMLPSWLYLRFGGSDMPNQASCDLAVPPFSSVTKPAPTTNMVAVSVGAVLVTIGMQVSQGQVATITLYDTPQSGSMGSINLNPTRLGQMVQQNFVIAGSYTLAFPAAQVHVSNYSPAWVYVAVGTLVVPTAATAMAAIPPMSERSLPCQPETLFAFGLSANLVTVGQQVPAGIRITATFYEFPTAVAIGTATLNPSTVGQNTQRIFTAAASYTIAFPATMIHVSNYSTKYVYVAYGTLIVPTAANAMATVPPMSERSLPCQPSTNFAFGLSAATIVAPSTAVPQANIVATFYEYPVPMSLGTAPLSPGGFKYTETLRTGNVQEQNIVSIERNLTNFNHGRYVLNWVMPAYVGGCLQVMIWRGNGTGVLVAPIAQTTIVSSHSITLEFEAGCWIITPKFEMYSSGALGLLGPLDVISFNPAEQLEAWNA